mmetsp:Transcript_26231/g.44736  ORF Transcript_26231/g.44736 Transcript_26231/m.44736 type:complete len:249 (+) Transcript_26231:1196-1942(+)
MIVAKRKVRLFSRHRVVYQAEHHLIHTKIAIKGRPIAAQFISFRTLHKRRDSGTHFAFIRSFTIWYVNVNGNATVISPSFSSRGVSIFLAFPTITITTTSRTATARSTSLRTRIYIFRLVKLRNVFRYNILRGKQLPSQDQGDGNKYQKERGDLPSAAIFAWGGSRRRHHIAVFRKLLLLFEVVGLWQRVVAVRSSVRIVIVGITSRGGVAGHDGRLRLEIDMCVLAISCDQQRISKIGISMASSYCY